MIFLFTFLDLERNSFFVDNGRNKVLFIEFIAICAELFFNISIFKRKTGQKNLLIDTT